MHEKHELGVWWSGIVFNGLVSHGFIPRMLVDSTLFLELVPVPVLMSSFEKVSMAEVKVRTGRNCKTTPLREEVLAMRPGDAIYVPYWNEETGEGYRPTTISQVVGVMSRASEKVRYSVRRDATRPGCFVLCLEKAPA